MNIHTPYLRRFEAAVQRLHNAKQALDTLLAQANLVRPRWRVTAAIAASDILSFCTVFRAIHLEAVATNTEQTTKIAASSPSLVQLDDIAAQLQEAWALEPEQSRLRIAEIVRSLPPLPDDFSKTVTLPVEVNRKLMVAYKSLFFFVRIYQDALFCVLKQLCSESVSEKHDKRSMAAALTPGNRIGDLLQARCPSYLPWFESWRKRRNYIKDGVEFSIAGPDADLGIRFVVFDEKTGGISVDCSPSTAIRISHVTEALNQSADVAELCLELAHDRVNEAATRVGEN